jgi:hypothetical protein
MGVVMNPLSLAATAAFIQLMGPDGQVIIVNPDQVVTVREPRHGVDGHFHKDVRCLLHMTDGHFVAVVDPCAVVRDLLEAEPD